jgi:S-formylglutathione hydrolase FrmB
MLRPGTVPIPAWNLIRSALLGGLCIALLAIVLPSTASAAQRLESFDLPSTQGNVDLTMTRLNNPASSLRAYALLPDGYDANPTKQWPVLYLLHGVGDNATAWSDPKKGDIQEIAKGLNAIVVMPEGGRGYMTDWWRGGQRVGSNWERYYLDEVIPAVQQRYRILPGRQNHAIGGISMGGYGGALLGAELPSYFGNIVSNSGLLDSQAPNAVNILPLDIGSPYTRIWGPPTGPYATVHNPRKLVQNLADSRVYVSAGNGTPSARFPWALAPQTTGALAEQEVRAESIHFYDAAKAAGVDVHYVGHTGVHDWPYWRLDFPREVQWGLFNAPAVATTAQATSWTYETMAPYGNAWGLGFKFAAPTYAIETFKRSGQTLTGSGSGTVTISPGAADDDASGNGTKPQCAFTAKLPFTHTLPSGC